MCRATASGLAANVVMTGTATTAGVGVAAVTRAMTAATADE
jgi:hypothetical protein